jgi:tRNA1Val (adenine37-N6)-methyltransferase
MRSHTFRCKQFVINQDRCSMKVCTDAMFLGAVADVTDAATVLDIGTGTGLLSLMIAQRQPDAKILALDIDPNAVSQATDNVAESIFKHQIEVKELDIKQLQGQQFDMIISNPPFYQASLLPSSKPNLKSHHASTLNFEELLQAVSRLLQPEGVFNVLLPTFEFEQFMQLALNQGFRLKKRYDLRNSAIKNTFRVVGVFVRTETKLIEETVIIYDQEPSIYSAHFKAIMKDFYTIF